MPRQTLTFLTPCFCGGADPRSGAPELRVPSVRGHLRYWTRVLMHNPAKPEAAALAEHHLFGGVRGKDLGFRHPRDQDEPLEALASRFVVRLQLRPPIPPPDSFRVCPHDPEKRGRPAFPPDTCFDLEWSQTTSAGEGSETDFRRVLKAWVLLGSLGCRANRAAGSVWRVTPELKLDDFLREIRGLWPDSKLPSYLSVKVLRDPTDTEVEAWQPPVRTSGEAWEELVAEKRELLRAIATDVLAFGTDHDGAFGYGGAEGRKGSPIKLKVGLFKEGYRLIAIVDRRNGRDGKLKAAIAELASARKPLGLLLKDAKLQ
jgi:hypothetical protein